MSDLEPFADKVWSADGALRAPQYRVGYRSTTTRAILTQLEIPAEIIERTVLNKLLVVPRITPNGRVTADFSWQNVLNSDNWIEVAAVPIDELVIKALAPENLRLEEARTSDLRALEAQLEESMSKVRAALAMASKKS